MRIANGNFDGVQPRVIYGPGSSKTDVVGMVNTIQGVKKVMVVMDAGIKAVGVADPIVASLKEGGYEVLEWADIERDPSSETVERGAALALENGIDVLVAVGGGGVIDVTKCMALLQTNEPPLMQYELGVGMPKNPCKPWIAVPTTSGTGSEATCLSIITNHATQRKTCIKSLDYMRAFAAILDPEITLGLPKGLTASTGMDAISHAIEAFVIPIANAWSDNYATDALRRLIKWLPVAVEDGKNLEARSNVQLGSCFAGIAFANASLNIGHAIAHGLGESIHVPHGVACAWGVNYAIRRACAEDHISLDRMHQLAALLGVDDPAATEKAPLIAACEKKIRDMNAALGVPCPKTFEDGRIAGEDCKEAGLTATWDKEQPMLQFGGAKITREELAVYFDEMWSWDW
jgi:alcohol dehydrogenase